MNILEGLNTEQQIAASYIDGPLLILSGAGSGKTRTLTHRIAYLVMEKGISPYSILAITFTNKAAKEMKERVDRILTASTKGLWISTFHSSCVRILRKHIERLGFSKNFVIFDTADQKQLLKECLKELNINEKNFPLRSLQSSISSEKDNLVDSDTYLKRNEGDFRYSKIAKIYSLYQKKLKGNNALDFDDIIFFTVRLFEHNKDVLEEYREKFKYILVDEYQDTNHAQYRLISLLAKSHGNICVVGDDDQSIYKFRGADIRNILEFEKEYKDCKVVKLEQNYRSTQNIISAANEVIKNNGGRKIKSMRTDNETGELIKFKECLNEHEEAKYIADEIIIKTSGGLRKYNDFAILYRMNAQSRVIEGALGREGIPYKIYGGLRFYDRKEIKDIIAYLRLIQNNYDDVSLRRIINVPRRGIGKVTLDKMSDISQKGGLKLFEILKNAGNYTELERAAPKLKAFADLIDKIHRERENMPPSSLIRTIIEMSGMEQELENENTIEAKSRLENLKEFISSAVEAETENEDVTLESYLEILALQSPVDDMDESEERVTLMTIHSAKGLEFPAVFISGMEDGVFPGNQALMDEGEIEEERRLCYVGMTRAEKNLYLTKARSRMLFGNTTYNRTSVFISEIPDMYIENLTEAYGYESTGGDFNSNTTNNDFLKLNVSNISNFKGLDSIKGISRGVSGIRQGAGDNKSLYRKGQRVGHKKFGNGTILKIENDGNDKRLEIDFDGYGMKRLMLSYAKLKIL